MIRPPRSRQTKSPSASSANTRLLSNGRAASSSAEAGDGRGGGRQARAGGKPAGQAAGGGHGAARAAGGKLGTERAGDLARVAELGDGRLSGLGVRKPGGAARVHGVEEPGSQFAWLVNVTPQADVRALRRSAGLVALLTDMERQGQSGASALSDYRDPWRDRLEALGIQSVHGIEGSAHPGAVYVVNDFVVSWGWVRTTADKWITDFLATELGQNKITKLAKADTDERHLAVLIHPDTDAGLGIAGALADLLDGSGGGDLPSVGPPSPLTHLWLIGPTDPPRAFRWTHSGWAVVGLPVEQRQAV